MAEDLSVDVPSSFRCPISLEIMTFPVTLCTGITYDRSSICQWLEAGHNTCPATMQELSSKILIPNLALRRLILLWFSPISGRIPSPASPWPAASSALSRVRALIDRVEFEVENNCLDSLSKIAAFARASDDNRWCLRRIHGVVEAAMIGALIKAGENVEASRLVIKVLCFMDYSSTGVNNNNNHNNLARRLQERMLKEHSPICLRPICLLLQESDPGAKIMVAQIVEAIASMKCAVDGDPNGSLVPELHRILLGSHSDPAMTEAILRSLVALSRLSKRARIQLLRMGVVQTVSKILAQRKRNTRAISEGALELLELLSASDEGRRMICEDRLCVPATARRVLGVSVRASESAVAVIWRVCFLCPDARARQAVARNTNRWENIAIASDLLHVPFCHMCGDLMGVALADSDRGPGDRPFRIDLDAPLALLPDNDISLAR